MSSFSLKCAHEWFVKNVFGNLLLLYDGICILNESHSIFQFDNPAYDPEGQGQQYEYAQNGSKSLYKEQDYNSKVSIQAFSICIPACGHFYMKARRVVFTCMHITIKYWVKNI